MTKIAAGKDLDDATMTLNDVDKVMTKLGLSLKDGEGQIRDLGEVLDEVGAKWNTFTRNEQNQLATAIAGTRQANFFRSAMGSWDEVLSGTEAALNSTGGATERMAIYTESLEGKLNTLQATWEEFVLNLQASDAFKSLIDLGTKLISVLDLLLNKIPILSNLIKTVLVVGAINVLAGTVKQLIVLMGKQGLVGTLVNVGTTITGLKSGFSAFTSTMQGGTGVISAITMALRAFDAATGAATLSMAGFIASIAPLLAIGAVVGAVGIVAYFNSAEKAAKDAKEAVEDFNEQQQKINETQSELDTINDKIAEINAKDGITLTDEQELIELKKQREEVKALLETYENLAKTKGQSVGEDIGEAVSKRYGEQGGATGVISRLSGQKEYTGVATDFSDATAHQLHDVAADVGKGLHNIDDMVGAYKELTEVQSEYAKEGKQLDTSRAQSLETVSDGLKEEVDWLQEQKEALEAAHQTGTPYYQDVIDKLSFIEQVTAPEAWQGHQLTNLLLGDDASQIAKDTEAQLEQLKQDFADGIIDEDTYREKMLAALTNLANDPDIQGKLKEIFPDLDLSDQDAVLNTFAETLGVAIPSAATTAGDYIKQAFDGSIESVDHMSEVTNEFANGLSGIDLSGVDGLNDAIDKSLSILNDADAALQAYQDDIDGMQSSYDSLVSSMNGMSEAMDFLAQNQSILAGETTVTAEQWQNLVDTASGISWINAETGETVTLLDALGISLNDDGTVAVSAQGGIQGFIGELQQNANATTTAMQAIVTAINQVRAALGAAATSAANWAGNVSSTLQKFNVFGIADGAIKALDGFQSKATGIASSMEKAIKDSTASSQKQIQSLSDKFTAGAENAKKQYDKVGSAAKKSGSSGSKSTKDQTDATKELTDALKEEYEAQKAILDAQKKQLQARKEALAQEKSDLADAKDAIENLIDLTMKMLKQQYQDQLDLLEKQADALDDQADAFEKKVEQQKEFLQLQKEEQEHADELAEKNQAIADVQAQLEELKYDNSAEAQKKRLELLDDLNSAQKDLTDYQNDYDYDTKLDELDKEKDAFQQQIDAQKEAIDQQKEYIKNTLMDEYNLYQEAIALIQGRSDEFYQSLVNWNRVKHRRE